MESSQIHSFSKRPPKSIKKEPKIVTWDLLGTIWDHGLNLVLILSIFEGLWEPFGLPGAPTSHQNMIKYELRIHTPKSYRKSEKLDPARTSKTRFSLGRGCIFHYSRKPPKRYHKGSKIPPKMDENGAKKNQGGPSRADMAWKAMDRAATGRNGPQRAAMGDKNTCKSYVTCQRYD